MRVLEYPYIIAGCFILCSIMLVVLGILFAVRGIESTKDYVKSNFTTRRKIEGQFQKYGKACADRCVLYISVSADDYGELYSESNIFSDINDILLRTFSNDAKGCISIDSEKNFIAFVNWNMRTVRRKMESCQRELNKCLTKYKALNIVEIRSGLYFAFGTEVSFEEALRRAKQACILAKNENVSYAEWDVSSEKAFEKKIKIENNIEKEIDDNHFFLEYQPVLDAKTKTIIGAEVLSRLNSKGDGVLTPRSFLSAVDSVGINEKFDCYIFEKTCKWISNDKNQREGYKYTINFSRLTVSEPDFAETIIGIIEKYNLNFKDLAVEVLEDKDIAEEARDQMIQNIDMLKKKGVSILLDDFGNGYTSFKDLQNPNISVVKIDKSVTQGATTDKGFIILKNVINMCRELGVQTLCEGIETEEQEGAAIKAGCDLLQGYYYYRPMPVSMFENLLEKK